MQARILIVEDEIELAELEALYLTKEGMTCEIAASAEKAFELLSSEVFDLLILDINLPGIDGFEFLQEFRKRNDVPVVIVSARETDEDILLGLGIGADEYVAKPFSPRVLTARVRALLRRVRQGADRGGPITFGKYALDPETFLLTRDNERVRLSSREFEVLTFLSANPSKTFSAEEIYEKVWGQQYGDITAIAVYIQRLRKKLEIPPGSPGYIETVRGRGYRFNGEPYEP